MAAGEAASRPPYLATGRVSHQHSMAQTRSQHGRAAALLLASSLLILGVVFLAGNSGGAAMLEEEAAQESNSRQEAALKLEKWSKQVDKMEEQVKTFQADANAKAVDELVHLERVKDLLVELKSQVPETPAPAPVKWGYGDGPNGPAHWGELDSDFKTCADGKQQSPINFELDIKEAALPSLGWTFPDEESPTVSASNGREVYDGYSLEVTHLGAPRLLLDSVTYTLTEFHLHTPSEHQVAGRHYDMEVHFVHEAQVEGRSQRAVVAAFFQQGSSTPAELRAVLEGARAAGRDAQEVEGFGFKGLAQAVLVGSVPSKLEAADAFIPNFKNYFQYQGSDTTPPCSEGVTWVVLKNPVDIALEDLDAVKQLEGKNNRPVQPLNGREVLDVGSML